MELVDHSSGIARKLRESLAGGWHCHYLRAERDAGPSLQR